jgi:hypothetical protein
MMQPKDFGDAAGKPPSWFARVPSGAIIDEKLTHAQVRILATVCTYANNQGFAWPNLKTIQRKSGVNAKTLDKAMKKLKELGYITLVSRFRSHPKWRRIQGCVYRIVHDDGLETDKLIDQMNNEDAKEGVRGLEEDDKTFSGTRGQEEERRASGGPENGETGVSKKAEAMEKEDEEKDNGTLIPHGEEKQSEVLDVEELVRATALAQQYATAAQQSHGALRLVNPRAVEAAKRLIADGWSDNEVRLEVMKELKARRDRGSDAPHHLGDCLGVH